MNKKRCCSIPAKGNGFEQAKRAMTEAALAMLQNDPRRTEKATRALAQLKAAEVLNTVGR